MSEKPDISIVIPAYNEARRLPPFLSSLISYCNSSERIYEIIVVDDGSRDKTVKIVESYKSSYPKLYTVRIRRNRGKGYAVKTGLMKSTGEICVFFDADGSVGPEEIQRNIHYIQEEGYDIFVGSRALRDNSQILKTKWYRVLFGQVFNFFVRFFLYQNIKDTQCGFKMFRREIVKPLFSRSHIRGFGFDIEILYLAHKMGYKVKEGPVSWQHVARCKVNLLMDSIKMFFNILQVRNWHCTPIKSSAKYMGPDEYKYMYNLESYHWWYVSRRNLVIHFIETLGITSPVILDIGVGTGINLLSFSKLGKTFGIDISEESVGFCKRSGIEGVAQCPAEKIRHQDSTFDIITCLDVLEHIPNALEAMLEMKRVLKDDGKIIILVPAFRILWSQHDEALCHLRRYEKKSLSHDLYEARLKIERIGYFFFTSFFAVAPIRIMRKFLVSRQKLHSDTTTLPPKLLNEFLKFLFHIEIRISDNFGLPFGTTLYAIVSKQS
jgi:dolichyl-phosphate beta-glucosyltransferase